VSTVLKQNKHRSYKSPIVSNKASICLLLIRNNYYSGWRTIVRYMIANQHILSRFVSNDIHGERTGNGV
jgi:hypothetical protein